MLSFFQITSLFHTPSHGQFYARPSSHSRFTFRLVSGPELQLQQPTFTLFSKWACGTPGHLPWVIMAKSKLGFAHKKACDRGVNAREWERKRERCIWGLSLLQPWPSLRVWAKFKSAARRHKHIFPTPRVSLAVRKLCTCRKWERVLKKDSIWRVLMDFFF
jgi:hypothetical protein